MVNPDAFLVWAQGFVASLSQSYVFGALKIFLALYVAVLIVDIILLFVNRDVRQDVSKAKYGSYAMTFSQPVLRKKWKVLEARLKSPNPSEHKAAVLEADSLVDIMLKDMGYPGENLAERLDNIPAGHFEFLGRLREAHEVRNRIVMEPNFALEPGKASEVIGTYRQALQTLELL